VLFLLTERERERDDSNISGSLWMKSSPSKTTSGYWGTQRHQQQETLSTRLCRDAIFPHGAPQSSSR
jgi:hypothetical protein